jgi:hypothetical protein
LILPENRHRQLGVKVGLDSQPFINLAQVFLTTLCFIPIWPSASQCCARKLGGAQPILF